MLKLSWDFVGKGLLFSGAKCSFQEVPWPMVNRQTLQLGNCEGTTKSPKVGPPGPNNSYLFLIEMMASHLLIHDP